MKNSKGKIQNVKAQGKNKKLLTFEFLIVLFTFAFLLLPFICFAQTIPSKDLIEQAKEYDGKIVSYQGEVIGDVMYRGDFAWVNINDGQNAIGIWGKKDLADKISYAGSYKSIGDTVIVTGKFNRACLQHGGDLDIHADYLEIVERGYVVKEKTDIHKIIASIAFLAMVLFLGLIRILRKGSKKR
ncbi:MAG TPA: DNA-binding protein [Candidatus Omnitrophota bacterium]|nr:DNA-binding protein [Candidatus Omnitrophota bacterium]